MSSNNNVKIIGKLTSPNSPDKSFFDEDELTGGYRSVSDSTSRLNITVGKRKQGMLVKELDTNKFYTLKDGITDSDWVEVNFGGGSNINYIEKSINYTALNHDYIMIDSTSEITITLPSSPTIGNDVTILDVNDSFEDNNITVARNGSNINSQSEDMILDINNEEYKFIYVNSTVGWRLI